MLNALPFSPAGVAGLIKDNIMLPLTNHDSFVSPDHHNCNKSTLDRRQLTSQFKTERNGLM